MAPAAGPRHNSLRRSRRSHGCCGRRRGRLARKASTGCRSELRTAEAHCRIAGKPDAFRPAPQAITRSRSTSPRYESEPGWFTLISGSAPPTRLLSLRYVEGLVLERLSSPRLGVVRDKVTAGVKPHDHAKPALCLGVPSDHFIV